MIPHFEALQPVRERASAQIAVTPNAQNNDVWIDVLKDDINLLLHILGHVGIAA